MKRTIKQEIWKQVKDQFWHFIWAFLATVPLACLVPVDPEASWNWDSRLLLHLCCMWFFIGNVTVIVAREVHQWPSTRWYDPPMDWAFFGAGIATAFVVL